MKLAKMALDVGLYTQQREAMTEFWQQEIGLPFQELLPVGRGIHQLRHAIGPSVFKLNHVREPLEPALPSGYRRLSLAREGLGRVQALTDPDGNQVRLVPMGHEGIRQFELELAVRDLSASARFYREVLQLEAHGEHRFSLGESIVSLHEDRSVAGDQPMRAKGYRYTTIQVYDVVAEHAGILERGGREGSAPVRLGEVAYISFVRDPDGNWIEISQRKSLTGSLA